MHKIAVCFFIRLHLKDPPKTRQEGPEWIEKQNMEIYNWWWLGFDTFRAARNRNNRSLSKGHLHDKRLTRNCINDNSSANPDKVY